MLKKPHPVSVERFYGLRGQRNYPLGNARIMELEAKKL